MNFNHVNVVYLFWLPCDIIHLKKFINSYVKHKSCFSHRLYILFNGCTNEIQIEAHLTFLNNVEGLEYIKIICNEGQDINAYSFFAKKFESNYILFLNTYSEILHNCWLKSFLANVCDEIPAISATGSMQSYFSSVFKRNTFFYELNKPFNYNINKYKLFLKAFFVYLKDFKPFPNPHIRTNAFLIKRDLFLEVASTFIESKYEAYCFESGRKGLSNQLLKNNIRIGIVDCFGKLYEIDEWKDSGIFWSGQQTMLLIADNQTRIYQNANENEKRKMTKLAWGK